MTLAALGSGRIVGIAIVVLLAARISVALVRHNRKRSERDRTEGDRTEQDRGAPGTTASPTEPPTSAPTAAYRATR